MVSAAVMRWLTGLGFVLAMGPACANSGGVAAQARTVTTRLTAYGQVQPIAVLPLRAAQTGIVTDLKAWPGRAMTAGALVGHLSGPEIDAFLAQRKAALQSARAALSAAQKALRIQRQKRKQHLSTQQAVDQAEAAVQQAQAQVDSAQTQWLTAQALTKLRAPTAGSVLSVNAADGERVRQGQTILILQPADSLWLKAVYHGTDAAAVEPGMHGVFAPADGGSPIPVKIRAVIGVPQPGGGRAVGLAPASPHPGWYNGEAGIVTLAGAKHTLAAVPTRALILDQGQWWVLVRSTHGVRRQAVTPGPSRGAWTLIERGLQVGTEVVVDNAYLQFHRDFSQQYQAPD